MGSRIRIVIADDNASVRGAMRQVLEAAEQGWEIIEAENGQQAVAQASKFRPDLVILDLVMPGMDGLAASREIAKLLPTVPILMHTLHCTPQLEIEAGKFAIRKVVPKSDSIGLVSAVQEVLDAKLAGSAVETEPASSETGIASRRTEDRIRELCGRLFATNKKDEAPAGIFAELQGTLHQHIEQLRRRVTEYPVVVDRRRRKEPSLPDLLIEKPTKDSMPLVADGIATPSPPVQIQQEQVHQEQAQQEES